MSAFTILKRNIQAPPADDKTKELIALTSIVSPHHPETNIDSIINPNTSYTKLKIPKVVRELSKEKKDSRANKGLPTEFYLPRLNSLTSLITVCNEVANDLWQLDNNELQDTHKAWQQMLEELFAPDNNTPEAPHIIELTSKAIQLYTSFHLYESDAEQICTEFITLTHKAYEFLPNLSTTFTHIMVDTMELMALKIAGERYNINSRQSDLNFVKRLKNATVAYNILSKSVTGLTTLIDQEILSHEELLPRIEKLIEGAWKVVEVLISQDIALFSEDSAGHLMLDRKKSTADNNFESYLAELNGWLEETMTIINDVDHYLQIVLTQRRGLSEQSQKSQNTMKGDLEKIISTIAKVCLTVKDSLDHKQPVHDIAESINNLQEAAKSILGVRLEPETILLLPKAKKSLNFGNIGTTPSKDSDMLPEEDSANYPKDGVLAVVDYRKKDLSSDSALELSEASSPLTPSSEEMEVDLSPLLDLSLTESEESLFQQLLAAAREAMGGDTGPANGL